MKVIAAILVGGIFHSAEVSGSISELAEKLEDTLLQFPSPDKPYELTLRVHVDDGEPFFGPSVFGLCNGKVGECMGRDYLRHNAMRYEDRSTRSIVFETQFGYAKG